MIFVIEFNKSLLSSSPLNEQFGWFSNNDGRIKNV